MIQFAIVWLLAQSLATHIYRSDIPGDFVQLELRLKSDGTYTLENQSTSCWLYSFEEGTWSEERGTITLRSVSPHFEKVQLKSQRGDRAPDVKVIVSDLDGKPLPDVEVWLNEGLPAVKTDRAGVALLRRYPGPASGVDYVSIYVRGGTAWEGMVTASGAYSEFGLAVHPASLGDVHETRVRRDGAKLLFDGWVLTTTAARAR